MRPSPRRVAARTLRSSTTFGLSAAEWDEWVQVVANYFEFVATNNLADNPSGAAERAQQNAINWDRAALEEALSSESAWSALPEERRERLLGAVAQGVRKHFGFAKPIDIGWVSVRPAAAADLKAWSLPPLKVWVARVAFRPRSRRRSSRVEKRPCRLRVRAVRRRSVFSTMPTERGSVTSAVRATSKTALSRKP